MNVVLKLFALQLDRHSPVEALAGLGLLMTKSGCFPFLFFLLFLGNGPARFVAGADTLKPEWAAHRRNAAQFEAQGGRRFEV